MPCVEFGYRLACEHWGRGYATEGAPAVLAFGFSTAELAEIVALTAAGHTRSRRVMERVGMKRNVADDCDHRTLPSGIHCAGTCGTG